MQRFEELSSLKVFGFANSQPLTIFQDKENVAVNILSTSKVSVCKKFDISEAEKAMDGAPQGEIFDVTVLQDASLAPSANPEDELQNALKFLSNTQSSWAEQHSAVESMRRLMLHNSSLISSRPDAINIIVSSSAGYISSLRSSTARNAILCISLLIESKERFQLSEEHLNTSVTALMQRTVAGPKFVVDSAFDIIMRSTHFIPFSTLFRILRPFSTHKNADTCSRTFVALSQCALSAEQNEEFHNFLASNQLSVVAFFSEGLTSKKTDGKVNSRKVLLAIQKQLGEDVFSSCVSEIEAPMLRAVVHKEVLKSISSFPSVATPINSSAIAATFSRSTSRLPSTTFLRTDVDCIQRPQSAMAISKKHTNDHGNKARGSALITTDSGASDDSMSENIFNFF